MAKNTISPDVATASRRVAALRRWHPTVEPVDALRDLAAANLADYITKTVDAAPPLTTEQRDRLALLLRGGDAA